MVPGRADLDVLASTSHGAADVAACEAAVLGGPCVTAILEKRPVAVGSIDEAEERWPRFGTLMRGAGFAQSYSVPMRWQGQAVGGLHFFWRSVVGPPGDLVAQVTQTFADVLTIAVVHVHPPTMNLTLERVQAALTARSVVEQAKGVLSHQRDIDMGTAYVALLGLADERRLSLGQVARLVVESATNGEHL